MIDREILDFIEENDVKFVRLGFCDPLGNQKNISVIANKLHHAFNDGIPFDSKSIEVFSDMSNNDLLLSPDPNTLSLLTWRPFTNSVLRFFCDIKKTNGTPFKGDSRFMLKNAISKLDSLGFDCKIGAECEFYLFKTDEDEKPTLKPLDNGSFLDISPLDKGENIRREICLCLEEMGLKPETSHHETGPGQNKITFSSSDILTSADNILTFKSIVKAIASRNGLFASFMPKPFLDKCGNSMHINISLYKDGVNLFNDHSSSNFKYVRSFIAGILSKIAEITLFLNTVNNSYECFDNFETPEFISWSHQERLQLIKIPVTSIGSKRMVLRSPDATVNPYIAFSLILYAGIYGIENNLELPNENSTPTDKITTLPKDLGEAITLAENSEFVKNHLDHKFLESYLNIKKAEFLDFKKSVNKETYYNEHDFEKL